LQLLEPLHHLGLHGNFGFEGGQLLRVIRGYGVQCSEPASQAVEPIERRHQVRIDCAVAAAAAASSGGGGFWRCYCG
jgi:hypothetical protein